VNGRGLGIGLGRHVLITSLLILNLKFFQVQ